jgi:hypothetical protein
MFLRALASLSNLIIWLNGFGLGGHDDTFSGLIPAIQELYGRPFLFKHQVNLLRSLFMGIDLLNHLFAIG